MSNFLGLTLDCNLNFKPHTKIIAAKISRVIGVLHKLKYIFPAYLLRGIQCPNIELLQKKAVRVVNFKSPVAHTEPILKGMNQLKLPDMYTCQLLKLYYKLYRNKLPAYFENFLPEYGDSQYNLRNNCIRLPAIRCEFGKLNAKYQMHFRLRELANPSNPPLYPNINIDNDVTTRSLTGSLSKSSPNFFQDTPCTAILGNVMLAITRSFHIFFIQLFAHMSIQLLVTI